MEITKRIEFDMGHRVPDHESKCFNLHGHRYVLEVTLLGNVTDEDGNPQNGMVIDFGELKKLMKGVHDKLDHGLALYRDDPIVKGIMGLPVNMKMILMKTVPTAENLCIFIWEELQPRIETLFPAVMLSNIRLYETPNSWADYQGWGS